MFTVPPGTCGSGLTATAEMVGGVESVDAFVTHAPRMEGAWIAHQYVKVPARKASKVYRMVPVNWGDSGSPASMTRLPLESIQKMCGIAPSLVSWMVPRSPKS